MRELIWSLSGNGITIIVSSHALSEIEKICSHIGVISKGKTVFEWTKEEFMKLGKDIEENYLSLIK
jgi:ABC-2 type transport system ATP-binding protein